MHINILTVFILAIFVGVEIITKVPPTLHTPLMSGSNAISGIAIVGAIISTKINGEIGTYLGLIAVIFAICNGVSRSSPCPMAIEIIVLAFQLPLYIEL